jgi:hypothetical protein
MLKRISSNRPMGVSVPGELKKEYAKYFAPAARAFAGYLKRYPGAWYLLMVLLLAASIAYSLISGAPLSVPPAIKRTIPAALVRSDYRSLQAAGRTMKQILILKNSIDSICAKPALSSSDSLMLLSDLDQLKKLNNH